MLPTQYQTFIHRSRYARFQDSLGRREQWQETVNRYFEFFSETLPQAEVREIIPSLNHMVADLQVMPSMRALMTAGEALRKNNIAGFNCSYLPIDAITAFDEAFLILLNGTGVGFSVERQAINRLPTIPSHLIPCETTIVVPDTKEGWVSALRQLISLLYSGLIPQWDVSRVRKAGSRLKTFGGRASGPEPLVALLEYVVRLFKAAAGRKLTSIEAHDLMCVIGETVIVGGVRRSALISLSNLSDLRMRDAKVGQWWLDNPQRSLANNSAVYTERPDVGIFMEEWLSLYKGKSGERGIVNRQALVRQAEKYGRTVGYTEHGMPTTSVEASKSLIEFGLNPCFAPGTLITTKDGAIPIEKLVGKRVSVHDGNDWVEIDSFRETGRDQPMVRVTLQDGSHLDTTLLHSYVLADGTRKKAHDLVVGDFLRIHSTECHGKIRAKAAYLKGFLLGDGTLTGPGNPLLWLYDTKYDCLDRLISSAKEIPAAAPKTNAIVEPAFIPAGPNRKVMQGLSVRAEELAPWCSEYKVSLPEEIFQWDLESKAEFLAGLFDSDGYSQESSNGFGYGFSSVNQEMLGQVQILLKTIGVQSKAVQFKKASSKVFKGVEYWCKDQYRLGISQVGAIRLSSIVKFSRLRDFSTRTMSYAVKARRGKIVSIERIENCPIVYCCTVPGSHMVSTAVGVVTGQCSEVVLRPKQFCNLTEAVCRSYDSVESLEQKVRAATVLGTFQATLTNFHHLSDEWKRNTEEEALLGVSMTGIMDCPLLNTPTKDTGELLSYLRETAVEENAKWAEILGIRPSASVTCVKPSGTVSQLVNSSSGIHRRYSDFYIRRVRQHLNDPLTQFMIKEGIPGEPDQTNKTNFVFEFPICSPEGSKTVDTSTALDELKMWKMFKEHWTTHNPSVSIYVREREWPEVGAWVWNNFDDISGLAFFPKEDHSYRQAPYEAVSQTRCEELASRIPQIDWTKLKDFETDDQTNSTRDFACAGGGCEL